MRLIVCLMMALPLIGCSIAPSLDDPKLSNKELNLEEFFDGYQFVARILHRNAHWLPNLLD